MNTEYRKLKNLFLRQSCQDAWEDYARSIRKVNFPRWDYVILTSSNEEQARSFRSQIADRLEQGVLPGWTKYFVLPDPEGKRVGSGGATLNVLRFLSEEEGLWGDFHNKRILVIHSGGDSKRVPQYSVCGKLFSPVAIFENTEFSVPEDSDLYLRTAYGDYMQLPPIEKRGNQHQIIELKL